jgi:Mrp family chromosome partitioning ATPase
MGKTYVFVNQKGGVGKTTSALNIGAYLAEEGKNVLLVDFDAQANLSSGVGVKRPKPGIYELLSGTAEIDEAVKKIPPIPRERLRLCCIRLTVCRSRVKPSKAKYSHCMGISTASAAAMPLMVSTPRLGGQSIRIKS